ncbi:MAG: Na(+)-translocating NADH-quinone reductase subunit A [Gammaproteobacteria bacterium]|nr:Na(+)-translocating NADH-quinone reductase subunit A [Gammaproteobacteria bacterium]
MRKKIRKGLDVPLKGAPDQSISPAPPVGSVAVVGLDYLGLKPALQVVEGETVRLGQALFGDKNNPGVVVTSPGSGVVTAINRGLRRKLQSIVIRLGDAEGQDAEEFNRYTRAELRALSREPVQENLIASGLWTSLRTRPFSRIPAPDGEPHSIFVTAIDTNPLAADPVVVIADRQEDFHDGLLALSRLRGGPVYLCRKTGAAIAPPDGDAFVTADFSGKHPAGLPGTHIHFLDPVDAKKTVWHIGYQDVIAIGELFRTGVLPTERVIALTGPMIRHPRLLRTRLGANVEELVDGEIRDGECRVLSGSALSGRRAAGWGAYLWRYHTQVTVLREGRERTLFGWLRPWGERFSAANVFFSSLSRGKREFRLSTSQHGSRRAMVPIGLYEDVVPLDILPTQLLRAILVGDTDTAQELGCLELDEEDLALCSFVCLSKYDFGPILRETLDTIEREG